MRKGDFGLKVLACDELDNGLVLIQHLQQYKLRLSNYHITLSCDASLEIDGKFVGRFRIAPYSSILIERPTNDIGKFTFYRHGTPEAKLAGLGFRGEEGIVSVTYYQEAPKEDFVSFDIMHCKLDEVITGGTGLSGVSNVRYEQAESLNIDQSSKIIIQTRLICHDEPRPLI